MLLANFGHIVFPIDMFESSSWICRRYFKGKVQEGILSNEYIPSYIEIVRIQTFYPSIKKTFTLQLKLSEMSFIHV